MLKLLFPAPKSPFFKLVKIQKTAKNSGHFRKLLLFLLFDDEKST